MSQHPQIKCREAVESSIKLLLERFEKARCDSEAVSECARCNAVFLAKSVREMLDGTTVPEARQSAATPGAYRWIEKAVMLLKIAQQRALPMEDFWCELDTILAGVPVPPQDLGFNSPADLYARAWHALHSVRSPPRRKPGGFGDALDGDGLEKT